MKKLVVIVMVIIITVPIVLFASYVSAFQYLVNKGTELVDEHCIKVNPHIIDRKNAFNYQYKIMMSSDKSQFKSAFNHYFDVSKEYINAEKLWLPKDKALLDSPLFNLILPTYLKDA